MKRYSTLMIDPPWTYTFSTRKTEVAGTGWNGKAQQHYETMRFHDIKALPVADLADENAVMWLWVVNPMLPKGFELLDAWGFEYKGMVSWAKTHKTWMKPFFGMGYWLRGATEHMLLGVRGKVKPLVKDQTTWFASPVGDHSEKPDHAYHIAERYYHAPRLEMFARRKRVGWDAWGNEVESDFELPAV